MKGAALAFLSGCSLDKQYVAYNACGYPKASTAPPAGAASGAGAANGKRSVCSTAPAKHIVAPEGYFVHEAAPMESVPRLAQTYGVSEKEIYLANSLKPGEAICPGRELLIPHPKQYKNIVPVYRNDKWQYIVVHHTAGETGKAITIDQAHRDRGFIDGLGYHFLVDNGSLGKGNGQLEVAPRWVKQEDGAHCKAGGMNHVGIGVSLVGNFNNDLPSQAQLHTASLLVATLAKYYKIPPGNIIGHRQAPGAHTDCPGTRFPWQTFEASLRKNFMTT